ncbi:hypothetical protein M0805_005958 [Coniferiporia weirii]|nr:hypothetical protein M0805_005958 [Coniferiporia weirii]
MSVNFTQLETHLATRSYIEGYTPSQADVHVFGLLGSEPPVPDFPNVARWYKHTASYDVEHASLPGTSTAGEAFVKSAESAKPVEEDEDEVDLFGSDDEDEEAERVKAERVKAYEAKKASKPKTIAKSLVTLEVKPWDDETNMATLEESVRSIEKPGLVWGSSKLVAIGFGIKKLQITLVIEDELVSLDELQEQIQEFDEYVQSTDVAAMQILFSNRVIRCKLFTIDSPTHIYEPAAALEPQGDADHNRAESVDRASRERPLPETALVVPFAAYIPSNYTSVRALSHSTLASSGISGDVTATRSNSPALPTSPRTRTRTDFELEEEQEDLSPETSATPSTLSSRSQSGFQHVRKRQRLDSTVSARVFYNLTCNQTRSSSGSTSASTMRFVDSVDNDGASALSGSLDSNSLTQSDNRFVPMDGIPVSAPQTRNPGAYTASNGNGVVSDATVPSVLNGRKQVIVPGNETRGSSHVAQRVDLPGTRLFEDSYIDREEFVRLVIQSLRDVGYARESAETLEAESGYKMESSEATFFRQCILDGRWTDADSCLSGLGVTNGDNLREAQFLISQQKYLELLEVQSVNAALHVLRNELAPLNIDIDELHSLSSLIMCSSADDLKRRAKWDGAKGTSRKALLSSLQRFISPSTMIPLRRFKTLIEQALTYERTNCLYHNAPYTPETFSLYADHRCKREAFPLLTTNILKEHADEVWDIKWSHDGQYLASASKDRTAFIWRIGPETEPNVRECALERKLGDHLSTVGCLAWSPNDSILLTSTDPTIKMWNARTGVCIREMNSHDETVSALEWLPNGSGFLSGGMDRKIIFWDAEGANEDVWIKTGVRVTDLAIAPDLSRMVVVGLESLPTANSKPSSSAPQDSLTGVGGSSQQTGVAGTKENRLIIYDFASRTQEASIRLDGELTSVKITHDSRYALVNHAPDEVQLWDLESARMVRKFTGQRQGQHVIRSCFGGVDGNFIISGSEDGNVYVWHRDTGALLEVLGGHGIGSVNAVAWNPKNERMFASCSDDWTVRIWESPHAALLAEESRALSLVQAVERNGKGKGREALR